MVRSRIVLSRWMLCLAGAAVFMAGAAAAEPPAVRELRTQRAGAATYFHVRLEKPVGYKVLAISQWKGSELQRRWLTRLPRLVSQDGAAEAVYPRVEIPDYLPPVSFEGLARPLPVEGLEFVGKTREKGRGKFTLICPTSADPPRPPRVGEKAADGGKPVWAEVGLELDFAAAEEVPVPASAAGRRPSRPSTRDDLEGLWASGQAAHLAVLEALTPGFGFYGFACEATGRKYRVHAPMLQREEVRDRELVHRRLYETTTGSAAITESLQLHRLLAPGFQDRGERTVDVATVPGITIGEHPWGKMMAGKKPSPEPLARLVPHDNFYAHFKSVRKFIEFGELLDEWGTNFGRAYEITSRDYGIKERYQKQLCLRAGWQGKVFGPAVVRSLALTGSDGYLREGSDLTVLFHVTDPKVFLSGVAPFLEEARRAYGAQLKEWSSLYHDVWIESYVTPHREVSLYRATFGDFVVYSNSPVALRRVIDAHQGRLKALADSLDFRYMRTVYRLEDELEDGFLFFSDAFIRQLVGPASKIKEKRRLEALTSLGMVTHGALFTAWENGRLPADHRELLAASALKPAEIYTPEGQGVTWDAAGRVAVSDVYNTLYFPTPLIELPIDKVTPAEAQEYRRFRASYVNLWRRYFDPVGMRFSLNERRVRVETYILPLIQTPQYADLRWLTGEGFAKLDPARFSSLTLAQGTLHLAPNIKGLLEGFVFREKAGFGDWALIRVNDTAAFGGLAERWVRDDFYGETSDFWGKDLEQLVQKFPITLGLHVKDPKAFRKVLQRVEKENLFGSFDREHLRPYRGVDIVRVRQQGLDRRLYHALIDDAWYVGFSRKALKDLIDQWHARQMVQGPPADTSVPINGSLYLAPSAAKKAAAALGYYLEWETQRRALANEPIWYALYRGGLVRTRAPARDQEAAARRFFGFVPVSPDGAAYVYNPKRDEVANRRHGTLARPLWHGRVEAASPLGRLLDQFPTMRADLQFREDGVNTTVTVGRKGGN